MCDGTIDMIATEHAPHSAEEKGRGFKNSLNGIVGLETSFPVLYTNFVKKGIISFEQLIKLMSDNPRKIFGIPSNNSDGILIETSAKYEVKKENFRTMGRSMPYEGMEVYGKCLATFINGRMVK
jgi:dihydroorotase